MSMSISIHAPHTRGDRYEIGLLEIARKFQSTPLIRGATDYLEELLDLGRISIHAPHTRGDWA